MRDIHLCHTINRLGWTIIFLGGRGWEAGIFSKVIFTALKNKIRQVGPWEEQKIIKQLLYTLQVLCLTFCQFSPKKGQPKDEKLSPPSHPKKIMVHPLVHRGGVFMKVPTLHGGEHRNKLRCLQKVKLEKLVVEG